MSDDTVSFGEPSLDDQNTRLVQVSLLHQLLEQLMQDGLFDDAVKMYMREGGESGDALIERFASNTDMSMRLANVLFRARDFGRAAQVCRNLGEHGRAAELFDRDGSHQLAAECYLRSGELESAADRFEKAGFESRAAELFLEAGDRFRAAVCFEKSGDAFAAGEQYFACRHDPKAIEQLQRVRPGSRNELKALGMLATVMERQGQPELALQRLREAARTREPGARNLELFFRLGELEYQHGERDAARAAFEKVAAVDAGFSDVSARLRRCGSAEGTAEVGVEPALVVEAEVGGAHEDLPELQPLEGPEGGSMSVTLVVPEVDQLTEYPLFADLSLQDVRALFSLAETREYVAGAAILEAGAPSPGLFLIRTGKVAVHTGDDFGLDAEVLELGQGDHFGEAALLEDEAPLGRVVALAATTLLFLPADRLLSVVRRSAEVERDVYRALARCMHENLKRVGRRLLESAE